MTATELASSSSLPSGLSRLLVAIACAPGYDPAAARRERFRPGDRVGRYVLLRAIGRGGCGVVFEAVDPGSGDRVAVKVARSGPRSDTARATIERERLLARLRHPNVVSLLETGDTARGPYLVFELLEGETLRERLERGRLPVGQAIEVALAVARALAHAHARGTIHRDLKPANVFLARAGATRVLDFGLAQEGARGRAPSGSGTPGYMAPEQQAGRAEDARTDLFALGVLISESADLSGAPAELAALVAALTEADPLRRPRSAGVVIARLLQLRRRATSGSARLSVSAGAEP
jgi:serine/threonine protein kinase